MRSPRSILITGASSGIGAALAVAYAAPGITLHLGGRTKERLEQAAEAVRARGGAAEIEIVDVVDSAAVADWIRRVDAVKPLDLVVANAGISGGTGGLEGPSRGIRSRGCSVSTLTAF